MTDLEGISGVDRAEMDRRGRSGHRFALERLMLDVNAAVEGALEGGAGDVYVIDGHGSGRNFIMEMLHPKAVRIPIPEWSRIMEIVDAYMEVGLHAMAGTINGFLDHTQSSTSCYNFYVNGRRCGELAQGAIYAGIHDVPSYGQRGRGGCVEARQFFGDIECAVVQVRRGTQRARLVDLDGGASAHPLRPPGTAGVVGKIRPYKPMLPLEIRLELCRSDMCDALVARCPDVERLDARTVRKTVAQPKEYRDILF
jgi:D-amino peptidase